MALRSIRLQVHPESTKRAPPFVQHASTKSNAPRPRKPFSPRHGGPKPTNKQRPTTPAPPVSFQARRFFHTGLSAPAEPEKQDALPTELFQALKEAFPHVRRPTPAQSWLLRNIPAGKTALLRDDTGRGKSLALLLALLSLPRLTRGDPTTFSLTTQSYSPRSLLLVPHAGLATQYLSWLHTLFPSPSTASSPSFSPTTASQRLINPHFPTALSPLLQILIPPSIEASAPPNDQVVSHLCEAPPHVLVATPNRLNDLLLADRNPRPLHRLLASTPLVAMDEVDALLSLPPLGSDKKQWGKWHRHVPTSIAVIERLRQAKEQLLSPEEKRRDQRSTVEEMQLVMMSATVGREVKEWIVNESEWLDDPEDLVIKDYASKPAFTLESDPVQPLQSTPAQAEVVRHHAVVVTPSSGTFRDVDPNAVEDFEADPDFPSVAASINSSADRNKGPGQGRGNPKNVPNLDPAVVEAVAEAFALELPPTAEANGEHAGDPGVPPVRALLLLPPTASLLRVVSALEALSVPCSPLLPSVASSSSSSSPPSENPPSSSPSSIPTPPVSEVLVASAAFAKGLDIPALTHVFLTFVPERDEEYLHLSGRVGRFVDPRSPTTDTSSRREDGDLLVPERRKGREERGRGKVVTFVVGEREGEGATGAEEARFAKMMRRMKIGLRPFTA